MRRRRRDRAGSEGWRRISETAETATETEIELGPPTFASIPADCSFDEPPRVVPGATIWPARGVFEPFRNLVPFNISFSQLRGPWNWRILSGPNQIQIPSSGRPSAATHLLHQYLITSDGLPDGFWLQVPGHQATTTTTSGKQKVISQLDGAPAGLILLGPRNLQTCAAMDGRPGGLR